MDGPNIYPAVFDLQQDTLTVSDTLPNSNSVVIDTVPYLSQPDSNLVLPLDTVVVSISDSILAASEPGKTDSLDVIKTDTAVLREAVIKPKTTSLTGISPKIKAVVKQNFIPLKQSFRQPLPFLPQGRFSGQDICRKPMQLDFFVYHGERADRENSSTVADKSFGIKDQNNISNHDWFVGVFILLFILLARVKLFFGKFFLPVMVSSYSYQASHKLYRGRNSLYYQSGLNFDLIYFFSSALFIFQLLEYYGVKTGVLSGFSLFLIIIAILFFWLFIKYLVCKLTGVLSLNTSLFDEYFHSVLLYNKNIGLLLLPIIIGLAYIDPAFNKMFVIIGTRLVFLLYFLRAIRLIILFISKSVSPFYSILYLCALEILPVLLLIWVFVPNN